MTTNLDAALYYATAKGWPVFRLQAHDKKPLKDTNGFKDAVTDPVQIREWWTQMPEANIGIATGIRANLAVADIDFGHGGEDSLQGLVKQYGDLPTTITAQTGGGGRHIMFAMPGKTIGNTTGKMAKGIDSRGEGGYVVSAPSLHPSGARYRWIDPPSKTQLAPMPEWMVDLLTRPTVLEYPQGETAQQENGVLPSGTRNQTMASLAGTMRRRGMGEEAIYSALLVENKNKCQPPLGANEIAAIAKSVCRYSATAAPALQDRTRSQMEWAFARAIFDAPFSAKEFGWVSPDLLTDNNIRQYWQMVIDGLSPSHAAGEAGILLDIERITADPLSIDQYAEQISKFGYMAGISKAAQNLARLAEMGDAARVESAIEQLRANKSTTPVAAQSACDGLMELQNELETPQQFIKTGVGNFDKITGGLGRGKLSILAGRPGMGKTTLAFQIARNVSMSGKRVLFLSLEMRALELWQKAAYGLAEITEADIQNNNIPAEKMDYIRTQIIPELVDVYNDRLFLFDKPPYTTSNLYKVVVSTQPDLVILDHLRKVNQKAENEVTRLGVITEWGKNLANSLNCHVMILAQLNRDLEKREEKEPQQSDLRDSGRIEEDADMVLMPHRPSVYSKDPIINRYSETKLFIRKNRSGGGAGQYIGLYMDLLQQWFYRRDELPVNFQSMRLDQ
jgi:replicative DNA helicase